MKILYSININALKLVIVLVTNNKSFCLKNQIKSIFQIESTNVEIYLIIHNSCYQKKIRNSCFF